MGSKNRIVKELIPILTKYLTIDKWYVEPFAGGMNVIDKIKHDKRIANDKNNYLISMWKYFVDGYNFPTQIDKEYYSELRANFNTNGFSDCINEENAIIGWVGFMGSCKGRFFDGGYCGGRKDRDFIKEHINNVLKQKDNMNGSKFSCCAYYDMVIPNNSIIYCDPPYANTKQYSISKNFDYDRFWNWCREQTNLGNDVIISEYTAPNDFVCIWEKEITTAMNNTTTLKPIEKLFVHKSISERYKH